MVGLKTILQMAGIGLICSTLVSMFKEQNRDQWALGVTAAGGILIFWLAMDLLRELVETIRTVFML